MSIEVQRPDELELLRIPAVGAERARRITIKNTLAAFQTVIGGYLEFVPLTFISLKLNTSLILVGDEEAKVTGKPPNVRATQLYVNSPNVTKRDLPLEPYIAGDVFIASEVRLNDSVELFSLPSHIDWEYFKEALNR